MIIGARLKSSSLFDINDHSEASIAKSSNFITAYLLNPTSLAKNNAVQLLSAELAASHIDVALICETWFTSYHSDSGVGIEGYTLCRKDRHKRKGAEFVFMCETL